MISAGPMRAPLPARAFDMKVLSAAMSAMESAFRPQRRRDPSLWNVAFRRSDRAPRVPSLQHEWGVDLPAQSVPNPSPKPRSIETHVGRTLLSTTLVLGLGSQRND